MSSFEPVGYGVVGGGWMAETHARALAAAPQTRLVAIADYPRTRTNASRGQALASKYGVETHYDDYRRLFDDPRVEIVLVSLPNVLHAEVALAALDAKKHVVVEKPLCFSLDDADRMLALARQNRRIIGYAEELCFCPKLVRAKELVSSGAIGELFFVKQIEAHAGPYSDWFFDPTLAGGGALMDMGCHSVEYARWMFGKAPVRRVTARMQTFLHKERTTPSGTLEDHVLVHLEWDDGKSALLESGWALQGGMESISRLQGTRGVLDVDLLGGNGMELFSMDGSSSAGVFAGWTRPDYEWLWQNGYPQELTEFARAVREERTPSESGADGRAVLEIIWAAYESAATGRTVELPFRPDPRWRHPVEPWIASRERGR